MTLHYEFPKDLTLDEVREIVRDNPNFYIGERDGYIVANYLVAGKDTHPPVVDRKTAIMRELRGLIFDRDGRVASRRRAHDPNCRHRRSNRNYRRRASAPQVGRLPCDAVRKALAAGMPR